MKNFINLISGLKSNKLASHTVIYSITSIINSAIPFLLLPVLTNYLTPSQYGIVSTFLVVVSISSIFIGMELNGIISVVYYKNERELVKKYVYNVLIISCLSFVGLILLTLLLKTQLEEAIQLSYKWILFGVVVSFFQFISLLNLTLWQLEQKPKKYGLFQILNTVINCSLSLLFIISLGKGEEGRIWAIALTTIAFSLFSVVYLINYKKLSFDFNFQIIKESLRFGVPLIPHAASVWLVIGLDRIFINNYRGLEQTGIYTTGFQIAMIISIIGTSFNKAFIPYLFKSLSTNDLNSKKRIVKLTYIYFISIFTLSLILSLVAPFLLKTFIDEKYFEARKYVLWIALGYSAEGMYYGVVNYLFYVKRTSLLTIITFSSSIVHVLISYLLIPTIGPLGAAYSTTISQFLTFISVWFISNRVYPMPWFSGKVSKKSI